MALFEARNKLGEKVEDPITIQDLIMMCFVKEQGENVLKGSLIKQYKFADFSARDLGVNYLGRGLSASIQAVNSDSYEEKIEKIEKEAEALADKKFDDRIKAIPDDEPDRRDAIDKIEVEVEQWKKDYIDKAVAKLSTGSEQKLIDKFKTIMKFCELFKLNIDDICNEGQFTVDITNLDEFLLRYETVDGERVVKTFRNNLPDFKRYAGLKIFKTSNTRNITSTEIKKGKIPYTLFTYQFIMTLPEDADETDLAIDYLLEHGFDVNQIKETFDGNLVTQLLASEILEYANTGNDYVYKFAVAHYDDFGIVAKPLEVKKALNRFASDRGYTNCEDAINGCLAFLQGAVIKDANVKKYANSDSKLAEVKNNLGNILTLQQFKQILNSDTFQILSGRKEAPNDSQDESFNKSHKKYLGECLEMDRFVRRLCPAHKSELVAEVKTVNGALTNIGYAVDAEILTRNGHSNVCVVKLVEQPVVDCVVKDDKLYYSCVDDGEQKTTYFISVDDGDFIESTLSEASVYTKGLGNKPIDGRFVIDLCDIYKFNRLGRSII